MAKGNSKNVSEKALLLTGKTFMIFKATLVFKVPKSGSNNINMTLTSKSNLDYKAKLITSQI